MDEDTKYLLLCPVFLLNWSLVYQIDILSPWYAILRVEECVYLLVFRSVHLFLHITLYTEMLHLHVKITSKY